MNKVIAVSLIASSLWAFSSACVASDKIEIIGARLDGSGDVPELVVKFQGRGSRWVENRRPLSGYLYVCGHREFLNASPVEGRGKEIFVGEARFPADNRKRKRFLSDGSVVSGWPEDVIRKYGICFSVRSDDMLFHSISSNEVRLNSD